MSFNPSSSPLRAATGIALVLAMAAPGVAFAQDQNYPPQQGYQQPPPGYDQSAPPPGYDDQDQGPQGYEGGPPPGYGNAPQGAYNQAPPPGYGNAPQGAYDQGAYNDAPPPPPPGYDGTRPPPPPPGYQPGQNDPRQQAADQQYAAYAQQWAQAYCVKAHGDAGAGAVIGGIAGALIGSTFGGHGAGAFGGAIVGAAGGAAIASNSGSNVTSPGCPPGYVVRGGAPAFAYSGYGGDPYYYDAPGWYRPWVFVGGLWTYRPYPYHVWYYGHYGRGYGRGYYGRGGYRGGYHNGRHW